jgi:hypothetical protein
MGSNSLFVSAAVLGWLAVCVAPTSAKWFASLYAGAAFTRSRAVVARSTDIGLSLDAGLRWKLMKTSCRFTHLGPGCTFSPTAPLDATHVDTTLDLHRLLLSVTPRS